MTLNIRRLKKAQILWLDTHWCQHGHTYLQHPQCLEKECPEGSPIAEKVGFFDIEASHLKANFGYIFTYCIKELDGDILSGKITSDDIRKGRFDQKVLIKCVRDLRKFDRLVVYYGGDNRFDIPFIRSRAVHHGLDFPEYKERFVFDLYPVIKRKFKLHSNRLQTACEFFGIPTKAHPIKYEIWLKAMSGDPEALDYILLHNMEDVVSTEMLWKKIVGFANVPDSSI